MRHPILLGWDTINANGLMSISIKENIDQRQVELFNNDPGGVGITIGTDWTWELVGVWNTCNTVGRIQCANWWKNLPVCRQCTSWGWPSDRKEPRCNWAKPVRPDGNWSGCWRWWVPEPADLKSEMTVFYLYSLSTQSQFIPFKFKFIIFNH